MTVAILTPSAADAAPRARQPDATSRGTIDPGTIDFQRLVGRAGWQRLPGAIRRRFAHRPEDDAPTRYVGTMHRVECSRVGFLVAQFCRLIGTPFAPWRGRDVPVTITLRPEIGGGTAWERLYHYPGRAPRLVRSVKQLDRVGRLLECVGGGFGMRLVVFESDGALHFESRFYFWRLTLPLGGRLTLRLPALLTPGTAHVAHAELGSGRFRFTMTLRHRWLGTTFHHDGIFHEEGDPA